MQNTNRLQLEYKEKSVSQDLRVVDTKVEAERKMHDTARKGRQEQKALDVKRHNRNLELVKSQKEYSNANNRRLQTQEKLTRVQGTLAQRRITGGDEPD